MSADNDSATPCAMEIAYGRLINLDASFYAPYTILGVLGTVLNFLLLLVSRKPQSLSKRATFRRLLIMLAVTDQLLCLCLLCEIAIYAAFSVRLNGQVADNPQFDFERFNSPYVFFIGPRDVLLSWESIVMFLLAVDRAVAVLYPTSARWNGRSVSRLAAGQLVWVALLGMGLSLGQAFAPACSSRQAMLKALKLILSGANAALVVASAACYSLIFVKLRLHQRRVGQQQGEGGAAGGSSREQRIGGHMLKISVMLMVLTMTQVVMCLPFILHYYLADYRMSFGLYHTFLLGCCLNPVTLIVFKPDIQRSIAQLFSRCWPRAAEQTLVENFSVTND